MITTRTIAAGVGLALSVAVCRPAHADADAGDRAAVEVGPEDGISCCNGVERFLFHGNSVLVTTGRAGIFRSEHRGAAWVRSMEGLVGPDGVSPFSDFLCQAPSEPSVVYALAGLGGAVSPFDGLFASHDFGRTWSRRGSAPTGFGFGRCLVDADDPRTVYVSSFDPSFLEQVWKSTDGGRTVHPIGSPNVALLTVAPGTMYFASDLTPDLFSSTDGGLTLHPVPPPPGPRDAIGFDASPDGRAIFVSTYDQNFAVIGTYRSTDGGASWDPVSGVPMGLGLGSLAFDPTDSSRVYLTDGLLRVSADAGLSFALLPASDDPRFLGPLGVREIGIDRRGSVFLSTRTGPFRTDDGGRTFRSIRDGFRASSVQDLALDAEGRLLVAVLHTQLVFRQAHGLDYHPIAAPAIDLDGFSTDAASVAGSPVDPDVLLVATNGQGLFRTGDGGRSWTASAVPGAPANYVDSRMAFATGSRVYLVSSGVPGLFRSDDGGRSFEQLWSSRFGAVAVDPTDPDVVYLGDYRGSTGLFKSTDGGLTLQDLGRPGSFSALLVDWRNPSVVYAGERFGGVLKSLDGGQTFAPASAGLAGAGVHGLAQDGRGRLFAWVRGGGLFSSDRGGRWRPVDTGEALQRSGVEAGRGALVADPHRPGRLFLGNAGVLRIDAADCDD